ncbi:MAG: DUF5320 domain-containing protein [Christensenellaceae bacterium]|nr:DUF5320 domain-containing protein [Christensenellaceae bacterium]
MPRMDGTGPMGFGRGMGAGSRTWNCRRGFGRGMGFCYTMPTMTKDELLSRKALLEKQLKTVEEQIEQL